MTQTMKTRFVFKAAASFGGVNTVQDFDTREAAEEWVKVRRSKGCCAVYLGRVEIA